MRNNREHVKTVSIIKLPTIKQLELNQEEVSTRNHAIIGNYHTLNKIPQIKSLVIPIECQYPRGNNEYSMPKFVNKRKQSHGNIIKYAIKAKKISNANLAECYRRVTLITPNIITHTGYIKKRVYNFYKKYKQTYYNYIYNSTNQHKK